MSQVLDRLLNVYWLRPETALWRSRDVAIMAEFEFVSPSLDLGCGDGLFSFIRAGGEFDPGFDAFQSVANTQGFFDKADIFDHCDDQFKARIKKAPDYRIDVGFDHKVNLLKKARELGLYRNLVAGNGNHRLPFADNTFRSMFSNIVYWLDQPQRAFKEIARVLAPGGRGCVMVPDLNLKEFSFYYAYCLKNRDERYGFLESLDRGRLSDNIKNTETAAGWTRQLESAGLSVVYHQPFLSKTLVQIWDIGLRPLFPVLHKMVSLIPPDSLLEIKREWIDTLRKFLGPIAALDGSLGQGGPCAFHCFIFEK